MSLQNMETKLLYGINWVYVVVLGWNVWLRNSKEQTELLGHPGINNFGEGIYTFKFHGIH